MIAAGGVAYMGCGSVWVDVAHWGGGVTYMSLASVLAMAVSEMGMLGGAGLHLGREVNILKRRKELSLLSLDDLI